MSLELDLKKYIDEHFNASKNLVYHYTKPELLEKILDCGYLKLHSHKATNEKDPDNEELKRGTELVREELLKRHSNYVKIFDKFISEAITFYTVSFCQDENSHHAIKKYGCSSIGFSPEFFRQFTSNHRLIFFGNVIYNQENQKNIIKDMIGTFDAYRESGDDFCILLTYLCMAIPLFKNEKKHHMDNECRIVGAEMKIRGEIQEPCCPKKLRFTMNDIKIYNGR